MIKLGTKWTDPATGGVFTFCKCPRCGVERWARYRANRGGNRTRNCKKCAVRETRLILNPGDSGERYTKENAANTYSHG